MLKVALVSMHASPLAPLGGVDAGGQNVHVGSLAKSLAALGCHVTVHTRRTSPDARRHVAMGPGIVIHHIDAGPATDLRKEEASEYLDEFAAGLNEAWGANAPTVAHAHYWMSGVAALEPARVNHLPLVQTFHTLGSLKRRHEPDALSISNRREHAERLLTERAAHIVVTSDHETTELIALGANRDRITVIPSGVDERFTTWGPQAPRAKHIPRVVSLGRLVARKGVDDAIRGIACHPTAELVIGGGPKPEEFDRDADVVRLRNLAGELKVADRVHFAGGLDRDAAAALVRSADVVVCPPWFEPFGIVALEAMACGVPVVATEVGGLVDTVVHGDTGILVPPRRPDLLGAAMKDLLDDPAQRERLARAGTRRSRRYRWERIASDTLSVYEALVEHQGEAATSATA
ncbi:MAG: putative glycosyl transferase [Acidimicrobiia bacterium]|nr:putative glycosyl transferase [Acidimicrobiia bacterium]